MIISNVRLRNIPEEKKDEFPWSLPLIQNFEGITFDKAITFFVGENGSGKSTILEGIAAASEIPIAGSFRIEDDQSLAAANTLADYLTLKYAKRVHHGFFVRAEDFIGFARHIKAQIKLLDEEAAELKATWTGGDIKLALGAIEGERDQLIRRYSNDLEAMSHGEGFIKFFHSRITGQGLYLIDEPEAALSPSRQLELLALIQSKVRVNGSQFIIATHSPIIMALPDSQIVYFDQGKVNNAQLHETEHYRITKAFLDNPELFFQEIDKEVDGNE